MKRIVPFILGLLVFVVTRIASAQQVDLRSNVSSRVVEVGDLLSYTVSAQIQGGSDAPTNPESGPTPGFKLEGTRTAPMESTFVINGSRLEVHALTGIFTLRATKPGTFTLGPGSIVVKGKKMKTATVSVSVVPKGQAPSTLDPFKGLLDFGDDRPHEKPRVTVDPKLALPAPRGEGVFLYATIDKTRAVVGEQVTFNVYLYEDGSLDESRTIDAHEATAADFLKRSLREDNSIAVPIGYATVGDKTWSVKLVRRDALFPLKGGHLTIEPMTVTFARVQPGKRETQRLTVDVSEPPAADRPPGYVVGDVGEFSLQANVTPRAIARDGAVGVTLELRGTGNPPNALKVPEATGIEWLEPTTTQKLGAMQNDRLGGTRTFSYVVRIHEEGDVDLGEVRLPFYDPAKGTYGVARASLGVVTVAKGPPRVKDAGVENDPVLPDLPAVRTALENAPPETYIAERRATWFFLFGTPLGCAFAVGAHAFVQKMRERRAHASPSLADIARKRRDEVETALGATDAGAAMAAIARAIEASVHAATGVNLRALSGDAAAETLTGAGVGNENAKAIVEYLRACETARFSPEGVTVEKAREAWAEVNATLASIRGKVQS